jgi:hypothetical protein
MFSLDSTGRFLLGTSTFLSFIRQIAIIVDATEHESKGKTQRKE